MNVRVARSPCGVAALCAFAAVVVACGSATPSLRLAPAAPTEIAPRGSAAPVASSAPLHAIKFEVRRAAFAPGDDVQVDAVLSERDDITEGGSYVVRGRYTLRSRERAHLALFSTSGESAVTPARVVVEAGSGAFEFRVVVRRAGYLRVSFYPTDGGDGFGSATFGRGAPAHRRHADAASPAPSGSAPTVHVPPVDVGGPDD
jgi:hypothetical protein